MREISVKFINELRSGYLAEIIEHIKTDHDLNLEIRDHFINLYYKGHALLTLAEKRKLGYSITISPKFTKGLSIPDALNDQDTTAQFAKCIPLIKQNILRIEHHSLEIEYEQMIIRANNFEPKNTTEYFIVDRQYAIGRDKYDLTGFYWPSKKRHANQEVDWCLMEVKFSLNSDIKNIDQQLSRYYKSIEPRASIIAKESELVLKQKLELGLYNQSPRRLEVMKTLTFSRDISKFQFLIILIDYNPYSSTFPSALNKLKQLPFAGQIRVYKGGFAIWKQNTERIL